MLKSVNAEVLKDEFKEEKGLKKKQEFYQVSKFLDQALPHVFAIYLSGQLCKYKIGKEIRMSRTTPLFNPQYTV